MHFFAQQLRVPASTPNIRDPKALGVQLVHPAGAQAGADLTTALAFWTCIDNIGDYITTDPTAAKRTIVNITGAGVLRGIIGPNLTAAGGGTTVFTVTVDGIASTVTTVSASNPRRGIVGDIFRAGVLYTTAQKSGGIDLSVDAGARASDAISINLNPSSNLQLLNPMYMQRFLKFDASLKVEVQCAGATLGAAGQDANSGVIWSLDP